VSDLSDFAPSDHPSAPGAISLFVKILPKKPKKPSPLYLLLQDISVKKGKMYPYTVPYAKTAM